jgi:hypothetical protein
MMKLRCRVAVLFVLAAAAVVVACRPAPAQQLDATLTEGQVSPTSGSQYSQFLFTVIYTEPGGQAPLAGHPPQFTLISPNNHIFAPIPMAQTDDSANWYGGGVEFQGTFTPAVDAVPALTLDQMIGTWRFYFEVQLDPDEAVFARFPEQGYLLFTVIQSGGQTMQGVDEGGQTHYGGLTIQDPDFQPTWDDAGSGSSTYVWRVRVNPEASAPWLEYTADPWRDTRRDAEGVPNWGYDTGHEDYPYRYTTGVVLYTRYTGMAGPAGQWQPHFMWPDPVLSGVYTYVAGPNCVIEDMDVDVPQLLGVRYGDTNTGNTAMYTALDFMGQGHPMEYFFVSCIDNIEPGPGVLRAFRVLDSMGLSPAIWGNSFDPNTASPFPAPTEPTKANVHPVLNMGWFRPNPFDQMDPAWARTRGTQDQVWNFGVNYQADDNAGATQIKVFITGDPNDPNGKGHVMTNATGDTHYEDGSWFTYQTTLPPGQHYVYWTANDGYRSSRFPRRPDGLWPQSATASPMMVDGWNVANITDSVLGNIGNDHGGWWMDMMGGIHANLDPRVNYRPVLTNPSMTPSSGGEGTTFVYKVRYSDQDPGSPANGYRGDPPRWAKLVIIGPGLTPPNDHIDIDMYKSQDSGDNPDPNNYQAGVVYKADVNNLPERFKALNGGQYLYGTYQYYCQFTDNWGPPPDPSTSPADGETVRLPQQGENYAGPTVTQNQVPVLTPATPPVESSDGSNTTATNWVFRVEYKDGNNDKPAWAKVFIDDPGEAGDGSNMTKQDPTDNVYTDGVIYEYKTRVSQGTHTFHFSASDGLATVRAPASGELNMAAVGANTVPHLLNGRVTPTAGPSATEFVYSVTYQDVDQPRGQAPNYIQVYIDGTNYFAMAKVDAGDNNYTDGAKYEYRTTLDVRKHTYHFDASDGAGRVVWAWNTGAGAAQEYRDPNIPGQIINIDGPWVNNPPVFTDLVLTPTTGTPTTEFNFSVTYSDPEGNPPDSGYPVVWIDDPNHLDDAHKYLMTKSDPNQTDFVAGVQYVVMVRGDVIGPGQHTYHVHVVSTGDGVTSDVRFPADQERSNLKVKNRPNLDLDFDPSLAGVNPTIGNEGTGFEFRVRFTDNFNLSPSYVRVIVMKERTDQPGSYYQVGVKDMVRDPQYADNNGVYTDGEVYLFPDPARNEPYKLAVGDYKYYFVANDRTETSQLPDSNDPGDWYDFHVLVNTEPVLTAPANNVTVSPASGTFGETYIYYIVYTDFDNNPPAFVKVHIDGSSTGAAMTKVNSSDNDYTDGVTYKYTAPLKSLARGVGHTYRFSASDGLKDIAYPATGTLSGPAVGNGTPVLSDPSVTPAVGTTSTQYTWDVTYADPDGDAPEHVLLLLDGASEANGIAMSKKAGQGSDYSAGLIFEYTSPPRLLTGDPSGLEHHYEIVALDNYAADPLAATPVTGTGPAVASALIENFSVTPTSVVLGQAVQVRGYINVGGGVPGNTTVTLSFVGPDGSGQSVDSTLDANNRFSYTFRPTVKNIGTKNWRVRAYWGGDDLFGEIWQDLYFDVLAAVSPTYTPGLPYMIAVPLTPIDPNVSTLFGSAYAVLNLIKWTPANSEYVMYGRTPSLFPAPTAGSGYWIKPIGADPISYEPFGTVAAQDEAFVLPVARGWNQIGTVFFDDVYIGDVMVLYHGNMYSLDTAATMKPRLVGNWAWRYDTGLGTYTLISATAASPGDRVLEPWVGYWFRAYVDDVTIILNPATRAREEGGPTRSAGRDLVTKGAGWSVRLEASTGKVRDASNYLGVSGGSEAQVVESPAYLENYVDLRFDGATRGAESGPLAVDLRPSGLDSMTWEFEVVSDQPNTDVRLAWSQLASAPKEYTFTLYDVDAQKSKFMRTSTYYAFSTGDAKSPRRFRVVADKNGGGVLMITSVVAAPSRGATAISYNLTREAEVQVKITDLRGRAVRTLRSRAATTGGLNTVTWDEKDGQGRRVPRGLYVVEVQGRTEDGQCSRAVQPVQIGR